ncbi:MAG TPA: Hpt domain-containing protein [Gemmatimonadales bacterium]|nr:Hpt domain-containing protein [Gemmatimonadales bacterium]
MTNPLGMLDYFAMEAGEYIDRLRTLVATQEPPAGAELVRFARALRGSALMANLQPIARAANGLEGLARALRDGQRAWDPATRTAAGRAVDTLAGFVQRAGAWTDADGAQAEGLTRELEALAGPAATPLRAPSGAVSAFGDKAAGLDAGARAFAAREGALIASALGQAAQALRTAPPARDAMAALLRRMQPLRGLAAIGDLPPLRDVLDAVDRAVGELGRLPSVPAGSADAFEAAAQALTRAARDVTERGSPEPDSDEAQRFGRLLLAAFAPASTAVPIAALLAGQGSVDRGAPPATTAARTDHVELISHGEFLAQAADELDRARSIASRDLRLYTIASSLRGLGDAAGDRIGDFAGLARDLIAHGVAGSAQQDFATALRDAGKALQKIPDAGPDAALATAMNGVIGRLLVLSQEGAAPAPVEAAAPPVAPIPTPAPAAAAPAPKAPEFHKAPAEPMADGVLALATPSGWSAESSDLAGSFVAYGRLTRERTAVAPSVDAFISGAAPAPAAAPVPSAPAPMPAPVAAPTPAPAPVVAPAPTPVPVAAVPAMAPAAAPDGIVDIKSLCYSGRAALDRALEVRRALQDVLSGRGGALRPLLDELLDLIELAARPDA